MIFSLRKSISTRRPARRAAAATTLAYSSPSEVMVVTTITSEADEYAKQVVELARRAGLRVDIDLRNEKINYKVREHSLAKIPALLVVGKKEAETHSVSIRRLGSDGQKVMPTEEALAALVEEATPPDVKRMLAAG